MEEVKRFVGIDVAKVALDVFIGSAGGAFSVPNDAVGIRQLLSHLTPADFVDSRSDRWSRSACRQRLGDGRDRGGDSQSQSGARLCPCHWQAGQDRPAGCGDAGTVW